MSKINTQKKNTKMTSTDMNTQLPSLWCLFSTYFASNFTAFYVKFKLVNIATLILLLWIHSMVIQSQNYS